MKDRTLDRLFRRYRDRNDGAALAAVFDATARELLDVACHLVRDAALAEDVVQETFLAAIRGAARWDAARPVKAWLYGILWREAAKARRSAARAGEPARLAQRGERVGGRAEAEPYDSHGALDALAAREMPEAVERALERLPRHYREVLAPLVRDGRAPEDIARELGRAPGTVRSQIHRGLERLRRLLPGGLAPMSGYALLPDGGAAMRGLDALRGEVLRAAGFSSLTAGTAGAVAAVALQASIGALLVSKTALFSGAAVLAAGFGLWTLRGGLEGDLRGRGGDSAADARVARGERTAQPDAAAPEPPGAPEISGALEPGASGPRESAAPEPTPVAELGAEPDADAVARWLARFNEAPDDWRHGWAVAAEIAALPPGEALAVMTGVWPHLTVAVKEQALKPFVFHGGHPHALALLHLAATDASLSVQSRAFTYLEGYAFRDFANDYEAYLAWAERWRDRPLDEVLTASAVALANDLLTLAPAQLAERLRELDRLDLGAGAPVGVDLSAVIRDAGGLQGLAAALSSDDPEAARTALRWSKTLRADEAWLRAHVLPAIEDPSVAGTRAVNAYLDALGRPDCAWAQQTLLGHLERLAQGPPADDPDAAPPAGAFAAAGALADVGDPAAIPALIDVLARDRSGRLGYAIGHFGLSELTGVKWQESHDAAWWLDWWEKNRARMPSAIGGTAEDE